MLNRQPSSIVGDIFVDTEITENPVKTTRGFFAVLPIGLAVS
jgi:hypothetical protein